MAIEVKVRRGGASAAGETDFTAQVPIFTEDSEPLIDAGMMAGDGSASQWQFLIDDDEGEIPTPEPEAKVLPDHAVVTISEDAPGFEAWIGRGRIASRAIQRGDVVMGEARQWAVTVDDANVDLRGLTLTAAWSRPAETDVARVTALLAAFCNGAPRASTVIANHFVAATPTTTMPAKAYPAGTELPEIIADCVTTAGKQYSVVIHHDAGVSHLCLLYVAEDDLTTFISDVSITDQNPDLLSSFPPIWDQGPPAIEEAQEVVHGILSRYSAPDAEGVTTEASVLVEDAAVAAANDYWLLPYSDAVSESAAQATMRATALRDVRSRARITNQVSIMLPATEVDRVCSGMLISFRAAAAGVKTAELRRVAQLKWEPISPEAGGVPGFYYAHMQLDKPERRERTPFAIGSQAMRAVALSAAVDRVIADLSVAGANMVPNSGFENAETAGWAVGAGWTFGHDPASPEEPYTGSKVARLVRAGTAAGPLLTPFIAVARTDDWWVSYWSFLRSISAGTLRARVYEYDAAQALLATNEMPVPTAAETEWTRRALHFGPDDTRGRIAFSATTVFIRVELDDNAAGTFTWDIDGIQVERGKLLTAYAPVPSELVDAQVGPTQIADDAVTTPKLVANAVVAGKIAGSAVTADKIAAGAVRADKLLVGGGRMLTNPDFESGDLTGWTQLGGGSVDLGNDPLWRAQGRYYAVIISAAVGDSDLIQPVRAGFHYGDRVLFSALMANSGSAQLAVLWTDTNGNGISVDIMAATNVGSGYGAGGPARQSFLAGPAPHGTVGAIFYLRNNQGASPLLVDDIWVSRVGDLTNPDGSVSIKSTGITVTNGKIIVSTSAGTIAIDGSNMFKIAATGTLALPATVGGQGAASVDLATGLTFSPASFCYLFGGIGAVPMEYQVLGTDGLWIDDWYHGAQVVNTNQTRMRATQQTRRPEQIAGRSVRYYVLKETA